MNRYQKIKKRVFEIISLVGIGIIAIPTGIIAAGFNQAIQKQEREEEEEPGMIPIGLISREELLRLQAQISRRLEETEKKEESTGG